jgi:hypothetical protein
MSDKKIESWDWDVRVRDRNIKRGLLDPETIQKHLTKLTDVSAESDPVTPTQPALGGREG